MSSIRLFRTFVEVARTGSFAAASERMALTPAAVSLQMKSLEQDLGYALFDRVGNMISLNPRGHGLLPRARHFLDYYEGMRNCDPTDEELVGTINVGAISSCMGMVAGAVLQIRKAHPRLKINPCISYAGDLSERVREGELDAAVSVKNAHKTPPGVQWTPLYEEPLVLIANRAAVGRADIAELMRERLFLRVTRSTHTGALIELCIKRNGLEVGEFLEMNALRTIVDLVQQDVGVAIVPLVRNATWQRDERLTIIELDDRVATRSIGLFEREQRSHFTSQIRRYLVERVESAATSAATDAGTDPLE